MRRTVILLVCLAFGCGGADERRIESVIRDSLGIQIVENADFDRNGDQAWQLGGEPRFSLGATDAAPAYQFHRLVGAAVLSDARIVVADAGSQEVRWFDAEGRHVATAGGRGEGPGEFTGIAALAVMPGDSIVVYDDGLRRLSFFAADARFVSAAPLDREQRPGMDHPIFAGVMADGSLLMVGRVLQLEGMTEGPIQSLMPLYRHRPDGSVIDSLGAFPGWEASVVIREHDGMVAMSIRGRPFGRTTSIVPVGAGFAAGTPHAFSFELYESNGALRSIVRVDRANEPVTAEDIETYEASLFEDVGDENARRELRREIETLGYPNTKPAYGFLMADRAGNVWAQEYQVGDEQRGRWNVFAPDGRWITAITTPRAFRIMDVGADYVLGVWRDEFDVEYLQLYDLIQR
jgi:hypothetical protein